MPDNVVDQVHRMARQQRANPGLMFGSRSHVGTANDDDMNDLSDDEEDEDYIPGEQEGDESEDAHEEDENGPHDHDHEDVGSIMSEASEHADDDATNMGDVDVETEMEVSSGRSPDGYGAGMGATPDVVDAKKRTNNHVESEGVDGHNGKVKEWMSRATMSWTQMGMKWSSSRRQMTTIRVRTKAWIAWKHMMMPTRRRGIT